MAKDTQIKIVVMDAVHGSSSFKLPVEFKQAADRLSIGVDSTQGRTRAVREIHVHSPAEEAVEYPRW